MGGGGGALLSYQQQEHATCHRWSQLISWQVYHKRNVVSATRALREHLRRQISSCRWLWRKLCISECILAIGGLRWTVSIPRVQQKKKSGSRTETNGMKFGLSMWVMMSLFIRWKYQVNMKCHTSLGIVCMTSMRFTAYMNRNGLGKTDSKM